MTPTISDRARGITVLAFDVDGVCTDGKLYYGPDGCALHAFHARDGLGIVKARQAGIICCAISGRSSKNVDARLGELKVPYIRQGVGDKAAELQGILAELQATPDQACFVGDDVNDLAVMAMAGLSVAVADAETAVLKAAHHVTRCVGGGGAIREIVELILTAQGRWNA
jgi:3-deoxy-D-manno-octulosonate 8-phosphate phosphatase (KDO 8-P phosphatase)